MYYIVAMGKPEGFEQQMVCQAGWGGTPLTEGELQQLESKADFGDSLVKLSSLDMYAIKRVYLQNRFVNIYAIYRDAFEIDGFRNNSFYGAAIYLVGSRMAPQMFTSLLRLLADAVRDQSMALAGEKYRFNKHIKDVIDKIKLPDDYIADNKLVGTYPENEESFVAQCDQKAKYFSYNSLYGVGELANFAWFIASPIITYYSSVYVVHQADIRNARSEAVGLSDSEFKPKISVGLPEKVIKSDKSELPDAIETTIMAELTSPACNGGGGISDTSPKNCDSSEGAPQKFDNLIPLSSVTIDNAVSSHAAVVGLLASGSHARLSPWIKFYIVFNTVVIITVLLTVGALIYRGGGLTYKVELVTNKGVPIAEAAGGAKCQSDFSNWKTLNRKFGSNGQSLSVYDIASQVMNMECIKTKNICDIKNYADDIVRLNAPVMNPSLSEQVVNSGTFDSSIAKIQGVQTLKYHYPIECQ